MLVVSEYETVLEKTLAEIIYWFGELLELQPEFDNGNILPGRNYGLISAPRKMEIKKEVAGIYSVSMPLDVLYEFSLPDNKEISIETGKRLMKLHHALAVINQKICPSANAPILVPAERFDTFQTQLLAPPHDWKTTIVGAATLNTWIQRDSQGVHISLAEN